MRGDECVGHHASLDLGISMFHPLVYKEAQNILNSVCFGCCNKLKKMSRSRARICPDCRLVNNGDYIIYAHDTSVAVRQSTDEKRLASSIPYGILPEGYVISTILVPPIHLRTPEDLEWSTDVQKLYEQLIDVIKGKKTHSRARVEETRSNTKPAMICAAYSKIVGAHRKEGVIGMMSGKGGIFRELMIGKRVESSARAVITGDPYLQTNEVSVPKTIYEGIRVKVTCGKYNIMYLRELAESGNLWWEGTNDVVALHNILYGMSFERKLQNGDLVMLNRQPSLSKSSLLCFKVVLKNDTKSNVLSINPQSTAPFNADFDGDEMNTFFMSNKVEMAELCQVSDDELTPVQDVVTGCYMMSKDNDPVSLHLWSDCITYSLGHSESNFSNFHQIAHINTHSQNTHGLLSMCIKGYDGSVLDKKKLKSLLSDGRINLYALQLIVLTWLSRHGLTVPFKSFSLTRETHSPKGMFGECVRVHNVSESSPRKFTKMNGETPDAFRERCLSYVKNVMSNNNASSGLMSMINSGAKGSAVHASHMALSLGQQYIGGKEGIFCERPYSRGLTPKEFFGHQMAAREGVVSTGVNTANTGYLNRRACKIMADLKVQYNGTVADDVMISSFHI
jgi:DNA-directed RNA polymerase II subunit RPB1